MERLTEKIGNTNCVKGCGSNCKYGFQHCRTEDWENCKTIDDVVDKLAYYEDLEEQGLLLRLPEESGYYLVTYHDWSDGNFLPKYDDTYVRRLHYQISEHFVGWNYPKNVDDRAENDCHKEVIAWQPLPEPYKERD